MKKPFKNTEFSDRICATRGCDASIKKNVVAKLGHRPALVCYECYDRVILQPKRDNAPKGENPYE